MLRLRDLQAFFMRTTRRLIGQAILVCLLVYFGFYAVTGDRGLRRWNALRTEIAQAQASLDEVRRQRVALEHRTVRLRDESLDLDLLSERARIVLNYSHPNDVIVMDAAQTASGVSFVSH